MWPIDPMKDQVLTSHPKKKQKKSKIMEKCLDRQCNRGAAVAAVCCVGGDQAVVGSLGFGHSQDDKLTIKQ